MQCGGNVGLSLSFAKDRSEKVVTSLLLNRLCCTILVMYCISLFKPSIGDLPHIGRSSRIRESSVRKQY